MAVGSGTISEWTITDLTKFIQAYLLQQPPRFLPQIEADDVTINQQLAINADVPVLFSNLKIHTVGGTGETAFSTGWQGYPGWQAPSFWLDPFGLVHMRGLLYVTAPSPSTTIFTLPPGFRPNNNEMFYMQGYNGTYVGTRVDVYPDGTVQLINPVNTTFAGVSDFLSLSGIKFRAKTT